MAKEKALDSIIDRDIAKASAKEAYAETNELLIDLVNYGSNLIARAFDQSTKKLPDIIIIGHFAKSAISALDSIQIGFNEASYLSVKLAIRALLEASFQLEWLLQGDTEKRAKQFHVSLLRQKKLTNDLYMGSLPGSKQLFTSFTNRGFSDPAASLGSLAAAVTHQNNAIDNALSSPEYLAINQEFQRTAQNDFDKHWYSLFGGPRSIKQLADSINKTVEYKVFYSNYSQFMHSSHFETNITFEDTSVVFENIRNLDNILPDLNFACSLIFRVYRWITQKYLPSEEQQFSLKYIQDWRERYHELK
jgi:hypothetical protein